MLSREAAPDEAGGPSEAALRGAAISDEAGRRGEGALSCEAVADEATRPRGVTLADMAVSPNGAVLGEVRAPDEAKVPDAAGRRNGAVLDRARRRSAGRRTSIENAAARACLGMVVIARYVAGLAIDWLYKNGSCVVRVEQRFAAKETLA